MKNEPDKLLDQVRQRIFDEDNLQSALPDIFNFISKLAPIWKMGWLQFHYDLQLVRFIAQALDTGGEITNFMYDTPREVMDFICSGANPDIKIVNDPEKDPVGIELSKRAKSVDYSCLIINFKNAAGVYASVMIIAEGKNKFTEEHSRRLIAVKEPLQLVLDTLIKDHEKKDLHPSQKEPVDDKNEFFRQVTRRLCGHLDLQTGVTHCLQYLSRFLPAEGLHVRQTEPGLLSERGLAESYGFFFPKSETLLPMITEESPFLEGGDFLRTHIINQIDRHPLAQILSQFFGNDTSYIYMPLIHKQTQIGIAVLGLEGRNRYTEEHMKLFEMLHDPFVLALSNNIKHREVIRLKNIIESEKKDLQEELRDTRSQTVIGASLGLKGVLESARLVSDRDSPVLLLGETGVGKEIMANFIHQNSFRKDGPLIKVNCGGIPDSLVDSELFGHEKGAFTGATSQKKGRFERANGGTIFLDEIGELPPQVQVRLLRVIQNRSIERVGGTDTIPVDIRIITATHRNLEEMVAKGQFREDLWFRLNVFPIRIPPLRSRRSDIPALVDHFIEKKSRELNMYEKPSLSPGAMRSLTDYDWPGNVRELENVIERELILSKGKPLTFQLVIQQPSGIRIPEDDAGENEFPDLDEVNIRHIKKALAISQGKVEGPGGAAELLKVKPNTLRSRMKKLGISYGWKR
jgi:transcriptional regulator with GAF, ATPase, and Fis domain